MDTALLVNPSGCSGEGHLARYLQGSPVSGHQALYRRTFSYHVISDTEDMPGYHVHSVHNIAIIYFICGMWACLLPLA